MLKTSLPPSPSQTERYNIAFGKVLRAFRRERRLSQEALAFDSGLDRTYVSLLERGTKSPTLNTMVVLCFALNLSLSSLATRIDEMVMGENI